MNALDIVYVAVVTLGMALFFGGIVVWMFTRPAPWKCLDDRRERLPEPNCRAKVVRPWGVGP
jgi:uncharacterized membrane protein